MIRGTLCRERVRAWSHRRLTPVDARESLTPGEPTYPRIRGVPPPHPHHGSAATRLADRFWRAGRGAQPVHPRMSVRRCAPDRLLPDGVPASGAWGGARSSPDVVASVRAEGSFRRPFREAECGAEPHRSEGWGGGPPNPTAAGRAARPARATRGRPRECRCSPSLTFSSEH